MVGECDDSWLNDARRMQITAADVRARGASGAAAGPVAEGAVGAGTGMVCCEWKGGIGTASRRVERRAHGRRAAAHQLRLAPSGSRSTASPSAARSARRPSRPRRAPRRGQLHRHRRHGRAVLAGPARAPGPPGRARAGPLRLGAPPRQRRDLRRLQHRCRAAGAAAHRRRATLNALFAAVVEASEEAVVNSLTAAADTSPARTATRSHALPLDEVQRAAAARLTAPAGGQLRLRDAAAKPR